MRSMRRGSLLVQVLVMGTMMLILAGALMRMVLMHYGLTNQTVENVKARSLAESSLEAVLSAWAAKGKICENFDDPDIKVKVRGCGSPGSCNCTCTVKIGDDKEQEVQATNASGSCRINIKYGYEPTLPTQ